MGVKKIAIVSSKSAPPAAEAVLAATAPKLSEPVKTDAHKAQPADRVVVLRRGQVWVVPKNAAGDELPAEGFVVDEKTYNRFYNNPEKFTLKKKAK